MLENKNLSIEVSFDGGSCKKFLFFREFHDRNNESVRSVQFFSAAFFEVRLVGKRAKRAGSKEHRSNQPTEEKNERAKS